MSALLTYPFHSPSLSLALSLSPLSSSNNDGVSVFFPRRLVTPSIGQVETHVRGIVTVDVGPPLRRLELITPPRHQSGEPRQRSHRKAVAASLSGESTAEPG